MEPGPQVVQTGRERDARGRFIRDNNGHLMHGVYSRHRRLLLAPVRQEMRSDVLSDLGYTEADAPRTLSIVIDQLVEARLIAASYFQFLVETGGPLSTKGRQRRCVEGFLKASATVAKFAGMIGLQRRTKKTLSPAEWLQSLDDDRGSKEQMSEEQAER